MESMVADDVTGRILAAYEAAELITSCAWCRRVELDESWQLAPRSALAAIDQFTVSHGVCLSCHDRVFPGAA